MKGFGWFKRNDNSRGLALGAVADRDERYTVRERIADLDNVEDLTLLSALGLSIGDDDIQSVFLQGKGSIKSATYRQVDTPASAIARYIATAALHDPVQTVEHSGDSGAGTTVNSTLSTTFSSGAEGPQLYPQRVFGLECRVGLQGAGAGTGTAAITAKGICGVSLNNSIQFRYPASGENGEELKFIMLFGAAVEGRYRYQPAVINTAGVDTTDVEIAARSVSIAWSGLPNNTKVDVVALNLSHEDVAELIRRIAMGADVGMKSVLL